MKIGLLSLGCPKNLVDSEVMLGLAQQAGHELTHDAAEADVLVVNTCAFIDRAKQESIDAILEMAQQKGSGKCRRLVVTGCLAERYRDELQAEIPEIDAVLGTGEVPAIVEAIEGTVAPAGVAAPVTLYRRKDVARRATGSGLSSTYAEERPDPSPLPTYLYDAETPRTLTTPRHFAYLKAAEGCDYTCSFCIIPRLRGHYRSRPAESILGEARHLAAQGVRELLLVSQDTTFYGIDRGERGALAPLLRGLDAIDDLAWVRLLYLYPTTITDEVLDAIAQSSRICRYIDLPLQHSAASLLKRMRRPGTRDTYERLLQRIRDRVAGVTLRTTFIVGFPGETEAEFDDLCTFVKAVEFDHVGVFTYSHEEGTAAFDLADDVPAGEKERRRRHLMGIQRKIVAKRHRAMKGRTVDVMVDGSAPEHDWVLQGRLEGQAPEIDPVVYLTDCDPSSFAPGQLVRARISGARDYDLVASPVPGV